jgi:hypothetical protein
MSEPKLRLVRRDGSEFTERLMDSGARKPKSSIN